ncbi:hypothetical protein EC968_001123 [Mortierella alpina]|nr:hypothetical protein EC968_001123 [Mortierella alpina]
MRFFSAGAVLFSIVAGASAAAGHYILYERDHFAGHQAAVETCGCQNLPYHDSYRWFAHGSGGRAYSQDHCAGPVVKEFYGDRDDSYNHYPNWKSIVIDC